MDRDSAPDGSALAPSVRRPPDSAADQSTAARLLPTLCLASFLAVINFAAPAPFFPTIARDLGTSVSLLGQLTTLLTRLSATLGLAIGPVADRYGHRRLLVAGVVAVAVNLLGIGRAPSYGALLALALVGGFGDAILFGLPLVIASKHFRGGAKRRAVAWTAAALPIGTVAGVPLLTLIGGLAPWRAVFVGVGLATLGAAALVKTAIPPDARADTVALRPRTLLTAYRPLLGHRALLRLYAAGGLRAACWVGLLTYLGAFLAEQRRFGDDGVALAYAAAGLGVFAGSLAAGRLPGGPSRPLIAAATLVQGFLFGALFVVPLGPSPLIALLPPAAFGGAIAFVGVATLLAEETPVGAATTMVLHGSVFNLGTALGGAADGLLLATGGYPALGLGLPIFAIATALLLWPPTRAGAPPPTRSEPTAA